MIEAKLLRSLLSLTKAGAAADNLLIDVREIEKIRIDSDGQYRAGKVLSRRFFIIMRAYIKTYRELPYMYIG